MNTDTPLYITRDPEEYGEHIKQRLLALGFKVRELRYSPYHKFHPTAKDPELDARAIDRASISEAYAESVKQDIIRRAVRVGSKMEANRIICGRLDRP